VRKVTERHQCKGMPIGCFVRRRYTKGKWWPWGATWPILSDHLSAMLYCPWCGERLPDAEKEAE